MEKFYQQLAQKIDIHLGVETSDVRTYTSLDSSSEATAACLARLPIEVIPMGFSQMSSGGTLDLVYYFCLKIVCDRKDNPTDETKDDFIQLGEKLAQILHGTTFHGRKLFLSKCMIVDSSFVLQNSNRRINVTLEDDQLGQILFFWAVDAKNPQSKIISSLPADDADDSMTTLHQTALAELFP